MHWLIAGGLALLVVVGLGRGFAAADPRALARVARLLGAFALCALAVVLLVSGRVGLGMLAASFALGLFGIGARRPFGQGAGDAKSGRVSTIETAMIRMTLDHRSGALAGQVLGGRMAGAALADLDMAQLLVVRADCATTDAEGLRLIEAYLDRIHGRTWRTAEDAQSQHESGGDRSQSSGLMGRDEAFAVLGLAPGASADAIKKAHHRLMMKLHPDQGGSDYLAAKINRAREVLLGKS